MIILKKIMLMGWNESMAKGWELRIQDYWEMCV